MSESLVLWAFGLMMIGMLLLAAEVLVPSGGVLGLVAGGCAIAGIVLFWRVDTMWGLSSTLAVMVLGPAVVAFGLKVWPNTYFGRKLILGGEISTDDVERRQAELAERQQARRALIGAPGEAVTDLRPVGMVMIEGERVEALAEGGVIEAGAKVRVTAVLDNQIKVRRAE